ncbi:hypothetical protein NS355_01790 [Sphingomonas yabuuchiae]|uniref:Uncharacterized protein n=1 Tax=Sphingomonas yabuuchiae TaxID=172044 RepID=A0A147IYS7_9SPHN|nr:hypothetical protein [Sphingomonas yabuuchiae]KTW00953.1 hypothetical protein NS355_01790 [Sphingomonas yabuuchiae]
MIANLMSAMLLNIAYMPTSYVPFQVQTELGRITLPRLEVEQATRASGIDQRNGSIVSTTGKDFNKSINRSISQDDVMIDYGGPEQDSQTAAIVYAQYPIVTTQRIGQEFESDMDILSPRRRGSGKNQGDDAYDRRHIRDEGSSNRTDGRFDRDAVRARGDSDLLRGQAKSGIVLFVLAGCCFGAAYGLALLLGLLTTGSRIRDVIIGGANALVWCFVFAQYI